MQPEAKKNRSSLVLGILLALSVLTLALGTAGLFFFSRHMIAFMGTPEISAEFGPGIFPSEWHEEPDLKPKASKIDAAEFTRVKKIVEQELKRYPSDRYAFGLADIYCVGSLQFYGVDTPSSFSGDAVYISSKGESEGYSQELLENAFHHEMARLLIYFNESEFNADAWQKLLPEDFEYDEEYSGSFHPTDLIKREKEWLSKGFLYEAASHDFESDFGSIAAGIMTGSSDFYHHVKTSPRLKLKAEFAAAFLRRNGLKLPAAANDLR